MKMFSMLAVVFALALAVVTGDADAASKRFGGGKSSGMQRESISADRSPSSSPSSAATANAARPPMAGSTPAAQAKRSWMGPLAGLAAGLGLAALASHFGFGEELASMLMIGLFVMAGLALLAFVMRRRAAAQATAGGLQYAAAGAPGALPEQRPSEPAMFSPSAAAPVAEGAHQLGHIPADFDVAVFVRNAKVNFIRLQAANDAGNLDDIREFTTPEMFAEIKMNISERGNAKQETDVVEINAEVLDVAEEGSRYIVSVRFTGLIREQANAAAEQVDEVWHMVKPRDGGAGWVLAGIQQMQ